eukprot:TRINITY_DN27504_c2_g1_i1.p1 TRINITY_DN27504_c2_g1~~TRINITY_DN27504_c2_g1_i1.p1  ORF type:complete len:257 (+),score=29.76 TRINITY_DN27504_c2_g1_i1:72-842(+)
MTQKSSRSVKKRPASSRIGPLRKEPKTFKSQTWAQAALRHWNSQNATEEGVTGLPKRIRVLDVRGSRDFLEEVLGKRSKLFKGHVDALQVLDVGAGIGRNTVEVLSKLSCTIKRIDLLEPSSRLRRAAREALAGKAMIGRIFAQPLQEFVAQGSYDLVWIQWVLMYVSDGEVVAFLRRLRLRLSAETIIAIKENVEDRKEEQGVDPEDCSVTRKVAHFEDLFRSAGFKILLKRHQKEWPTKEGAFPVVMWSLIASE